MSPALADRFSTTAPPGKPHDYSWSTEGPLLNLIVRTAMWPGGPCGGHGKESGLCSCTGGGYLLASDGVTQGKFRDLLNLNFSIHENRVVRIKWVNVFKSLIQMLHSTYWKYNPYKQLLPSSPLIDLSIDIWVWLQLFKCALFKKSDKIQEIKYLNCKWRGHNHPWYMLSCACVKWSMWKCFLKHKAPYKCGWYFADDELPRAPSLSLTWECSR